MDKKPSQGFSSLVILVSLFIFIVAAGSGLYLFYGRIPFLQKLITGIDKTDPDWKMTYCSKELEKLPVPPFKYEKKSDVNRAGPTVYLSKMMPTNLTYSDVTTCSFSYDYIEKEAWPSVGVEYKMHIDNSNQFEDTAATLYAASVDSSWKRLSRVTKENSGTPFYGTDSFPLLFTRENPRLGTVEYLDVFPAVNFYVKLSVFEK